MSRPRSFRSDNNAGLCPEAMAAMIAANDGHVIAYSDDPWTARAVEAFKAVFGDDIAVFFVANGTAANALAIASLAKPWQQIVCHPNSHVNFDESTVHERLSHCRVVALPAAGALLAPQDVDKVLWERGDVHQPQPGVLTISNSTELGAVYQPSQVKALCAAAHEKGYRVHVDGARFANAAASVGCEPGELAGAAGVDVLCFGGTKNGLAFGEAVIFFRQGDGRAFEEAVEAFEFHRKSTGHLLSKHRFVAAPFEAVLSSGAWLTHARHANAMAARLARGLGSLGLVMPEPAQANGVFVRLSPSQAEHLRRRGHEFYPFGPQGLHRFMCSFDTKEADVDGLVADAAAAR